MKKTILKLFGFLLLLNVTLFAETLNTQQTTTHIEPTKKMDTTESSNSVMREISLDSFGSLGMIIMVILSSFLGMFFIKDEFSTAMLE